MPKNNHGQSAGTDTIEGLRNAISYARGKRGNTIVHKPRIPRRINVKAVRARLGMSQQDFAARFGISSATVRNWEQGRRQPEGPARVLLTIIDREPDAVRRALRVR